MIFTYHIYHTYDDVHSYESLRCIHSFFKFLDHSSSVVITKTYFRSIP